MQIQAEACRLLGKHLGVDRAYCVEVNVAENHARVNQDYLRGDSPTLVGIHQFTDFGWIVPHLQRGETVIVEDTQSADIVPDGDKAAMATIRIVSHISLPPIEAGALVGALCVTESVPRQWSAAEVELVRETAERIWATILRARAETSLRESEAKYRSLFENVNDGFCIIELLYDDGQPIDYRFLEVNPAFENQSGFKHAIGKTARELAPNLEAVFLTYYETVLATGEPIEFEIQLADVGRYFRVAAHQYGDPQNKQLN